MKEDSTSGAPIEAAGNLAVKVAENSHTKTLGATEMGLECGLDIMSKRATATYCGGKNTT